MSQFLYDDIGVGYSNYRRPDPRIAAQIAASVGWSRTVVNVGAGAGSYEPLDRSAVAVEPSIEMGVCAIRKRSQRACARLPPRWIPLSD